MGVSHPGVPEKIVLTYAINMLLELVHRFVRYF